VSFLAGRPAADAAKALAAFKGPERMHLDGEHLYIDFPNGAGTSKLTPSFLERALGVKHTARNWNTVVKLLGMARNLSA
jgi:uncharacterized protein (DUF1697 family)